MCLWRLRVPFGTAPLMCNLGVRTLPNTQTCSLSNVARNFLGLAVMLAVASQAHAQQYFYYPQTAAPSYQPQYYYTQPTATYTQTPGYYYITQPYQTAYTPQYYQYYYCSRSTTSTVPPGKLTKLPMLARTARRPHQRRRRRLPMAGR